MFQDRRLSRSQHFFHNRTLVKQLVRWANLEIDDTVIEIGPGKGIITSELVTCVHKVIAVEMDHILYQGLKVKFANTANLSLKNINFLSFRLPDLPYKVVANLPFGVEGKIIRKLLDGPNPPQSADLVVIKDVGERWCGKKQESVFAISHKPWFEMKVIYQFKRYDFLPPPKVMAVLIQIRKRKLPLLPSEAKNKFRRLVKTGFSGGRRIGFNLGQIITKNQLITTCQKLNINPKAKPSQLSLEDWLNLYKTIGLPR